MLNDASTSSYVRGIALAGIFLLGIGTLLSTVGSFAQSGGGGGGNGGADARSRIASPFDVFAARSPGARPHGALWNTKPSKPPFRQAFVDRPHERVLTSMRERDPGPVNIGYGEDPLVFAPMSLASVPPGEPFGPVDVPPFVDNLFPPGPGGDVNPPPPPPPPVPEPATWAMMIGGLMLVARALRRARGYGGVPSQA